MLSLSRIIRFLNKNKKIRIILHVILLCLALLYACDVLFNIMGTWGNPAFKMTHYSINYNQLHHCLYDVTNI